MAPVFTEREKRMLIAKTRTITAALLLTASALVSAGNGEVLVPIYALDCKTDLVCATKVQQGYINCQAMVETQEEVEFCIDLKQKLMKKCTSCVPINLRVERVRLPVVDGH